MRFDKDKIKNELSIEDIEDIVSELGGEPQNFGSYLTCKTICHGGNSHKLYYYNNTKLFKCYTGCENDSFDIFELVCKVKNLAGEKKYSYVTGSPKSRDWVLPDGIEFVAIYFGFEAETEDFLKKHEELPDWKIFENYEKINKKINNKKRVELHIFDDKILKNLPHPRILPWEKEHISREVMAAAGICYDPRAQGIVIPHYNIDNKLVGIRERTLVRDNEQYGKYRPAILNGIMYNHPLSFNLYNINNSNHNIQNIKKAIVFESEKSCLLYASYFGIDNDISVACCGSNLIGYQFELLQSLSVNEIIIAFDRQYKELNDIEHKGWIKKLYGLYHKYGCSVQISYLFDKQHRLGYKDSPIDMGKDIFLELFKERIFIE